MGYYSITIDNLFWDINNIFIVIGIISFIEHLKLNKLLKELKVKK